MSVYKIMKDQNIKNKKIDEASSGLANILVDLIDDKNKKLKEMRDKAKDAEEKHKYFESSILYKELLGEAQKQNNSDIVKEAKIKMIEMNKLSKDDFKQIKAEQEVPKEEIEEEIKYIIGDNNNLEEILHRIGQHPHLYPKKKEIEESSSKNKPIFTFIASNHIISEDNHALGGNDPEYIWYLKNYGIHQDVIMQLCMGRIFYELENKHGLTFDNLTSYLKNKKVFSQEDFYFIELGLKSYFNNDYCSAIHILIPRFEGCFIELSKALGINTVSLKRPKKCTDDVITSDITLSTELLRKKEFTDVWSEDFCENIIYVFYERLGYGLRNKVAHGFISVNECSKSTCQLIIYFYLVLASRIKIIEDKK
ncbi:MAG: DUF4209 domain-containing protein [Bacilli bacterium]|nr:DUF4209 domain-containing protein [Bacilli bacterium]